MEEKRYWFKAKIYGYGWYPATWQAWLIILVYLVIFMALVFVFESNMEKYMVFYFVSIFAVTGLLVYISYKKGEPAKWRWGKK